MAYPKEVPGAEISVVGRGWLQEVADSGGGMRYLECPQADIPINIVL